MLLSWGTKGAFDDSPYFKQFFGNIVYFTLPRAYGLIKLHEDGFPVTIVVSAIRAPLYFLDKGLSILFNALVPRPQHSCKDSL